MKSFPELRPLITRWHSQALLIGLLGFVFAISHPGPELYAAADDNRFAARFQNGTLVTHHEVQDLFLDNKEPNIKGQRFFDPGNPIRTLRDTFARAEQVPTGLELANGDIIPGEIITHVPASAVVPAHFLVRLPDSPSSFDQNQIAVREGELRRYWTNRRDHSDFEPGLAVARDGRRWQARAIRFAAGAVQILTAEGISNVVWSDLARLDLLQINSLDAAQRERIWTDQPGGIVRAKLANGGEITFARPLAIKVDESVFMARPSWAVEPLRLLFKGVVSYAFRQRDEMPLSLLPVVEAKKLVGLQMHPWRRNETPDDRPLRLGEWTHDLGLALHAPQEITFELPPGAETLDAKLGVPHLAGQGCVKVRIHRDSSQGPKLWESEFLTGGAAPVDLKVNLDNALQLTLVIDMAHQGRPTGADPLDIRDDVILLDPIVRIRASEQPEQQKYFSYFLPALDAWEINAEHASKFVLSYAWLKDKRMCEVVLAPKTNDGSAPSLELRQQATITPLNARFIIEAARGGEGGKRGQNLRLLANGEPVESTEGKDFSTTEATISKPGRRDFSLGNYLGKKVELTVVVEPRAEQSELFGLWIRRLDLSPLFENLPSNGQFLVPDVRLETLTPSATKFPDPNKKPTFSAGKTSQDKPLQIRGLSFQQGFSVPIHGELTYSLDEKYTRFVAVIGLADGGHVGPYSILLDEEPFWADGTTEGYDRHAIGKQIDLAIPAGHKTITLRAAGRDGEAAWAQAGFIQQK